MIARCFVAGLWLLTLSVSLGEQPGIHRKSFFNEAPPELVADKDHWLGTAAPVTLAKLKGKVVWLQFNF
jgi:hypothetical protein